MKYKIGSLLNVPIYLHSTLLIPFALMLPILLDNISEGLLLISVLISVYFCILLHEFGHILMARHFGIRCKNVVLTPIGGLALLNVENETEPKSELLISLAGPLVNIGLAALLAIICLISGITVGTCIPIKINIGLFIFNMLPFYPMDGGRILKSALQLVGLKSTTLVTGFVSFIGSCFLFGGGIASGQFTMAIIGLFLLPFNLNMLFGKTDAQK